MDDQDTRRRRAADNQSMFRSINDRVEDLNEAFDQFGGYGRWTCECADVKCVESIELTMIEYAALRKDPKHFAIAPTDPHFFEDVEIVVSRGDRYWIVEKVGAAGERAVEIDAREGR
jgi:hypothetical protein